MISFKDKVAVVTGAGSGIGRELARQLAGEGATVIAADIDQQGLAQTERMVKAESGRIFPSVLDVSRREQVHALADKVLRECGRVDIVINNAGVALSRKRVEEMEYADFEWIVNINLWGAVYGSKAFLPHLKARPEAFLVNVSSIYGLLAVEEYAPYCTSKFAVRGFTEALRQELYGSSVHVAVVHPGGIRTNIARNARWLGGDRTVTDGQKQLAEFEATAQTPAGDAAKVILEGMRKKKNRILIGKDARFLDKCARLFPATYDGLVRRLISRKGRPAR